MKSTSLAALAPLARASRRAALPVILIALLFLLVLPLVMTHKLELLRLEIAKELAPASQAAFGLLTSVASQAAAARGAALRPEMRETQREVFEGWRLEQRQLFAVLRATDRRFEEVELETSRLERTLAEWQRTPAALLGGSMSPDAFVARLAVQDRALEVLLRDIQQLVARVDLLIERRRNTIRDRTRLQDRVTASLALLALAAGGLAVALDRRSRRYGEAVRQRDALKFTADDGVVQVRAREHADGVHVSVADDGVGIAPEHLEHLFEPFWQDPHTAARGTGLGLAIVQNIIKAHRGRVWAESLPGQGTTLHFILPLPPESRRNEAGGRRP
jgi:hypothetical protein